MNFRWSLEGNKDSRGTPRARPDWRAPPKTAPAPSPDPARGWFALYKPLYDLFALYKLLDKPLCTPLYTLLDTPAPVGAHR